MPRPATLASVENAITGILRTRATCPTALTDCANSGPMIISAPSEIACWAPFCAPCGVPPSSFTSSWMFGLLNSASAISAAFFIDCAATPALPCADSGRTRPTRTWPSPTDALAVVSSPGWSVGRPAPQLRGARRKDYCCRRNGQSCSQANPRGRQVPLPKQQVRHGRSPSDNSVSVVTVISQNVKSMNGR